jgi:signal transduction histidine kinase
VSGDRVSLSVNDEPSSTFVIPLQAGAEPRIIYVRLSSTSTRLAHFEVLSGPDLRREGSRLDHLGALYLTIIGVFLLWGLVQLGYKPNILLLTFVVYQAATLLFSLGMLGYARLYLSDILSPEWIDHTTSVPAVAATGAVMFFCIQLLREISDRPWYSTAEKMVVIVYATFLSVMLLGLKRPILQLNMIIILVVPIVFLVLSWVAQPARGVIAKLSEPPEARLPKPVVIVFFAVSCFFTLMTALPALGLLPGVEISLYIVLFYALTSGSLMVSVLYYRGIIILRRQTALAAEAGEQRLRAEQERKNRLERERLLAMLGHELKTPLATMRMLLMDREIPGKAAERLQSSVTDMAHVVERTVQTSQVEDDAIEVRISGCDLQYLVAEVLKTLPGGEKITFVREDNVAPLRTQTDGFLVQVILRNLLDNGLKYSAADSPILVMINPVNEGNRWSISVSNRPGHAGWPDRTRVFDKYYRSPTASHRSGSGLGLYMIQGIAKTLGGRIVYEPDATWVRFRLEFPYIPEVGS